MKYIFDVDGTLTPSRQVIDDEFEFFFLDFCDHNDVYLATGSDYAKTLEQLDYLVCHAVKRSYNCSGNSQWYQGVEVYTNDWQLPDIARQFLEQCLAEEQFDIRTGTHIEERPGMVNYSVIGRGTVTPEQRAAWIAYDKRTNSRHRTADAFNTMFPDLQANVGGETGLDIAPKGCDKAQIAKDFDADTMFFGDATHKGGNDYPLAQALLAKGAVVHTVEDWQHTWRILNELGVQHREMERNL